MHCPLDTIKRRFKKTNIRSNLFSPLAFMCMFCEVAPETRKIIWELVGCLIFSGQLNLVMEGML